MCVCVYVCVSDLLLFRQCLRFVAVKIFTLRFDQQTSSSLLFIYFNFNFNLNSWNTKYSQNVTCVCKNILSVKHILLECPITTELFQKNGYDLMLTTM